MKKAFALLTMLAATVGTGFAGIVNVDFFTAFSDGFGNPFSEDIAAPAGYQLGSVTLIYDNYGCTVAPCDAASVSTDGITGTTGGTLSLVFANPVSGFWMDFSLLGLDTTVEDGAMYQTFQKVVSGDGSIGYSPVTDFTPVAATPPGPGLDAAGNISYTGGPVFDKVDLFFSSAGPPIPGLAGPEFNASSLSYDVTPEPGSIILMGAGLLLVGAARLRRRKAETERINY